MKSIILWLIALYRRAVPEKWRRPCLFKESCSTHVMRAISESGAVAGITAFHRRLLQCRGGYQIMPSSCGGFEVVLADGSVIPEVEASEVVMRPFADEILRIEQRLNEI